MILEFLRENPLLLLFLVIALGQIVGRIQVAGFGLGIAAVLFVGLGFGAIDPEIKLPDFVYLFGLILFVYTIGLSSGPSFFASLRKRGLRDNGLALIVLGTAALVTLSLAKYFGLKGPFAAGLFCGSLTNTPALAAALDSLKLSLGSGLDEKILAQPVVAYSLAYPVGVLGMLMAVYIALKKPSKRRESGELESKESAHLLETLTVRITQDAALQKTLKDLRRLGSLHVSFGRLRRGNSLAIATEESVLEKGDCLSLIGSRAHLDAAVRFLGEVQNERLDLDRSEIDFRRIFVSHKNVTEIPLKDLAIGERFGASLTRIRRGDIEFIPDQHTLLELGDRVRIVANRDRMTEIARFFGDSYKALSEIDVITFSIGIAMGLLLGKLPIPLPGGGHFELGLAGGPLIVGMLLGRQGRTGPFVWTLPYSANLTLRQLGITLFLAGVGLRSGHAFGTTLSEGGAALPLFVSGVLITCTVALLTLFLGRSLFKIPMPQLVGILAGLQTQPAVLAFAVEKNKDESTNLAYASVYPLATILKILVAQWLLTAK